MGAMLKPLMKRLYVGSGPAAVRFRYGLILFDFTTILFFIVTASLRHGLALTLFSIVIGLIILADFCARLWIANDRQKMLRQVYTMADIVVIFSLLLDPFLSGSLAFLRILRGLRLIHSYHLLGDLRRDSRFFRNHEDAVIAAINLFVFVFVTSSAVHAMFFDQATGTASYVDALYFTVATLTTTGFGDITLNTQGGKLFSVFIMVVGVALFLQLVRAVFQPQKVHHTCPECGLSRHEPDAVHCKHCGVVVRIETTGQG